jgi:hypothetical protein
MSVKKSSEIAAAFCEDGVKSLAVKQLAKGPQERDLFRWNLVWKLFWLGAIYFEAFGLRCLS